MFGVLVVEHISICSVFIFIACVTKTYAFLPNRLSTILQDDFTCEDITKFGILRALDHGEESYLPSTWNETSFDILLQRILPDVDSETSFLKAVEDIVYYNVIADVTYYSQPEWRFADEKIRQGNELLIRLKDRLLHIIGTRTPDYAAARKTLGEIFHLIQAFYSNTNWVEMNATSIYSALGVAGRPMIPTAPAQVDTCSACGLSMKTQCVDNLLVKEFLTSGYMTLPIHSIHENTSNAVTSRFSARQGKCQDGRPDGDVMTSDTKAVGGIDKASGDVLYSHHFYNHGKAGMIAIAHTQRFLDDEDYGLLSIIGRQKFENLLGIQHHTDSNILYIDLDINVTDTGDIVGEITATLHNLEDWQIVSGIPLSTVCSLVSPTNAVVIVSYASSTYSDLHPVCPHKKLHFVMLDHSQDQGSRDKRAVATGLGIYNILASQSGGSVYMTNKGSIAAVVDIIKASVSSNPPVTISKLTLPATGNDDIFLPVDDQIYNLTIKIQGASATVSPNPTLFQPNGIMAVFRKGSNATLQLLGTQLMIIQLTNPNGGKWRLHRVDNNAWDVEVSAKSNLDFTFKFLQPGPGGFGLYPLTGRPIAGANTTLQVSVPGHASVKSVDKILLLDGTGRLTDTLPLQHMGGRRGQALYRSQIVIPRGQFRLAIEGIDKSNHTFQRMDPVLMSTLSIKLDVLPLSGTLYINKTITIPYRVEFVGNIRADVEMSIIDDKGFAQPPTKVTYHMPGYSNRTGQFVLEAGPTKGQTTTVTLSAKIAGAPQNEVQFSVQRITVEQKIVRAVDNIPPTCNVTSTTGKCNFGSDVCACSNYTWSMSAVLGDVGFGLQSVFASGAGNKSRFTKDHFAVGHIISNGVVKAHLSADCCHQHAKITVVDLAGHVGLCNVTITPGFVPPDPKLCVKANTLLGTPTGFSAHNVTRISCNTTVVTASCDLRNDTCSGTGCNTANLCRNHLWIMNARLGNEGFGKYQIIPVNAGRNSNLTITNRSLSLSADCCHPSVFVNAIDIASNVGQCQFTITVYDHVRTTTMTPRPMSCTNVTNAVCDLNPDNCSNSTDNECKEQAKSCHNVTWNVTMEIMNGIQPMSFNNVLFINATLINNTLELSGDCCHSNPSVDVIDSRSMTTACQGHISTLQPTKANASGSSMSVGAIVGGVLGGVVVIGAGVAIIIYFIKRAKKSPVGTGPV